MFCYNLTRPCNYHYSISQHLFSFTHIFTTFLALHVFLYLRSSIWDHFLSAQHTFFTISFNESSPVTHALSFCLSENVFALWSFMEDVFPGWRILGCLVPSTPSFYCCHWQMSCWYMVCYFFFAILSLSSLSLSLSLMFVFCNLLYVFLYFPLPF